MSEYKIYDKKELAQRLIDGEVFVNMHGSKVYFDETKYCDSPFRLGKKETDANVAMETTWDEPLKPYDPKDDWADKSLVWAWNDNHIASRDLVVWDRARTLCSRRGSARCRLFRRMMKAAPASWWCQCRAVPCRLAFFIWLKFDR